MAAFRAEYLTWWIFDERARLKGVPRGFGDPRSPFRFPEIPRALSEEDLDELPPIPEGHLWNVRLLGEWVREDSRRRALLPAWSARELSTELRFARLNAIAQELARRPGHVDPDPSWQNQREEGM
jgi:hypothetical protein